MSDYGRELSFGVSLVPLASEQVELRELARLADRLGLDLIAIQDHPYQRRFLDTFALLAYLLAETERIRVSPDVANLPLRSPPTVLAKVAATLDVLSGGRFELGLGAGTFWDRIEAMGGRRRTPAEGGEALGEAIEAIRAHWRGEGELAGPAPAHPIEIWVGAYKPRMLALTGRIADGWIPSAGYLPPEEVPERRARIDEAAAAAGRDPGEIRRLYNVSGAIGQSDGDGVLHGSVEHWADTLAAWALELGFDTFVFWPREERHAQIERFAGEVVPAVRAAVKSARATARRS